MRSEGLVLGALGSSSLDRSPIALCHQSLGLGMLLDSIEKDLSCVGCGSLGKVKSILVADLSSEISSPKICRSFCLGCVSFQSPLVRFSFKLP